MAGASERFSHRITGLFVYAAFQRLGFGWLGRSLRSLPRLTPPQFASPGLAPQALIWAGKPSFTTGNVICHLLLYNIQNITKYI